MPILDPGQLGCLFRKFGVAYSFPRNVHSPQLSAHLPWCPFPQVPNCPKYSFFLRANLPQASIYFGAHLPRVPFIRCPYAAVPICPKCPFTPNSPYLPNIQLPWCPARAIVPIISPNHHLPRCPFAPSTQLFGTQMSKTHLSGTQMYGPQLSGTIYPGAHLSGTQMYGLQLSEIHLPGARAGLS